MVKIEIITKSIVERIIRNEMLKLENRVSKILDRQRKRILEIDDKINKMSKPIKLVEKNQI